MNRALYNKSENSYKWEKLLIDTITCEGFGEGCKSCTLIINKNSNFEMPNICYKFFKSQD